MGQVLSPDWSRRSTPEKSAVEDEGMMPFWTAILAASGTSAVFVVTAVPSLLINAISEGQRAEQNPLS